MRGDRPLVPCLGITRLSKQILKLGSRGQQVVWVQQRLKDFGFDPGDADGEFGIFTEEAVRAFQRAYGLRVDGKVGPATRHILSQQRIPQTMRLARAATSGHIGSKAYLLTQQPQ